MDLPPQGMHRLLVATVAVLLFHRTLGSGGITDDERLLVSDGMWHRKQRKRISFETSCYYTSEPELPYGCQYVIRDNVWAEDPQRALEKNALLELFDKTLGKTWRANDNWSTFTDPCWDSWYGVTCDEHGYVIALELTDNRLFGGLPASLGALTSLLKLDLSSTERSYHSHANENMNRLVGILPSLSLMTRLQEIEISGNAFRGLPEDLYLNGATLRVLSASHNLLSSLPSNLQNFQALHTLDLSHNLIEDSIPSTFGRMSNIRYAHLQYNLLQGDVPPEVIGISRIRILDLSHNPKLSGEVPEEIIVAWKEMDYLAILNTTISGYISSLCLDVPFCWNFMYDTHKDLTWATAADVPDIVSMTLSLAKSSSR